MYQIKYLPIAVNDLKNILLYIRNKLLSPTAANKLIDDIEYRVSLLSDYPEMGRKYQTEEKLAYEYRMLQINNYTIFYTVMTDAIEIHRIISSKMDLSPIFSYF